MVHWRDSGWTTLTCIWSTGLSKPPYHYLQVSFLLTSFQSCRPKFVSQSISYTQQLTFRTETGRTLGIDEYPTVVDTWKQMEAALETGEQRIITH